MSPFWEFILFILALLRVIIEFTKFDLCQFPLAKRMCQLGYEKRIRDFHRMGFFLGLGYVMLTILEWVIKIV